MGTKTHWRHLTNEPNLGHWDLEEDGQYKSVLVTIERIEQKEHMGKEGKSVKPFIKLKEFQKTMICNKTNFDTLQQKFGTFKWQDFIGKQILLTVGKDRNPQKKGLVDCLRFSLLDPKPKEKQPFTSANFEKAKAAKATVEAIKKAYTITPEVEKEYTEYYGTEK
jgi:hypothetical protein